MTTRPDDPHRHTQHVKDRLDDFIEYLRTGVRKVEEPQAKALFETAAETLGGLKEAFEDYERKNEEAWQSD